MFANKKREGINTFACVVSLYVAETREATIKDHEPPLPLIPLDIVAYGFVGLRFLKRMSDNSPPGQFAPDNSPPIFRLGRG